MLSADGGSHALQTTEVKELGAAAVARPLLGRQLCTLRTDTARTPVLRGLEVRTVTVLRADALRAVDLATPTAHVSCSVQLFAASWIRTRT